MGQSRSVREVENPRDLLSLPGDPLKRSTCTEIGASPKLAGRHAGVGGRSLGRAESLGPARRDPARSRVVPPAKRRSCDDSVWGWRANGFEGPPRGRRSSAGWRTSHNEPDGADVCTLGPRGVPDGAECTLRDQLVPKPRTSDSLEALERQYDDIKSAVRTMEEEFDVLSMREARFPDDPGPNASHSEAIQSAYERMRAETRDLGVGTPDSLSKRLGRELKIRKRRSEEHRVIRSPSERKIGTIRRRSRELVQGASKSVPVEGTPARTPKMKGALLQTPINASLRRGKPNSVKSGLPVVVRAFPSDGPGSPLRFEGSPLLDAGRRVVVSRRGDESGRPLRPSRNDSDFDDGTTGSFLERLPGPTTRRRSSLSSATPSAGPRLLERPPETEEQRWMSANEFIDRVEDPEVPASEESVGRPSLAALMKQKKVTANVRLFNNLHGSTPRRKQQDQVTPGRTPPERSAASERRLGHSKSLSHRTDATPRELLRTRRRSSLLDVASRNSGRMAAAVSPLKESTWINIQREHSRQTPKAYKGEATVPQSPLRREDADTPLSSVFPRGGRVQGNSLAPIPSKANPPKLPPRLSARPSPIRIQYR